MITSEARKRREEIEELTWSGIKKTRQDKIREGIKKFLIKWNAYLPTDCGCQECLDDLDLVSAEFVKMLHSQGVVIKVEREIPKDCEGCKLNKLIENCCSGGCAEKIELVLRLGYTAVEPLVKDGQGR